MMNPFSWLQMTNMISYQGLVRTFPKLPAVLQPLLHSGIMLATLSAVVLNVFFNGYQHHADLVKESVSDKDLKVRTVRMWLLMRKLKKNEHGE